MKWEDDGAGLQDQPRDEMDCARRRRCGDQGMDGIGMESWQGNLRKAVQLLD